MQMSLEEPKSLAYVSASFLMRTKWYTSKAPVTLS